MIKSSLCQEKSAFRNPFTIDDFGLENGDNMVRISFVSVNIPEQEFLHEASLSQNEILVRILTNSSLILIFLILPEVKHSSK